jgi:hypothetical protein
VDPPEPMWSDPRVTMPASIPPLVGGGIMPTWRCTNSCRHCLYDCSPRKPDEWISAEMTTRTLSALARERSLREIHIGGGEPCLDLERLAELVRHTTQSGLPLAYVETNAFWCSDREATLAGMRRLHDAGLSGLLVSVSMFHNEFVPFGSMQNAVEVAREVFGPWGVIVYLPHLYELLARLPGDGKRSLEEFCRLTGMALDSEQLPRLYGVIPGGRAARALRHCYASRPAAAFAGRSCADRLLDTSHFHIDSAGDLFTGLCAGLSPASVEDLHPEMTPESHPLFLTLVAEGPFGLMTLAARRHGYEERRDGYVSPCDLCLDVRRHLWREGSYSELRPACFYEDEACDGAVRDRGQLAGER